MTPTLAPATLQSPAFLRRKRAAHRPRGAASTVLHVGMLLALCALLWGCGGGGGSGDGDGADDSDSITQLGAPANAVAVAGDSQITLTWDGVDSASHYFVYGANRSGVSPDNYSGLPGGVMTRSAGNGATLDGLDNGATYYLVITAADANGEGPASSEVQATPAAVPQPPGAPQVLTAVAGNGSVTLSWNGVPQADSYNLYVASEGGVTPGNYMTLRDGARLTMVSSPVLVGNLLDGTRYFFVVTALSTGGESNPSETAAATPFATPSVNANLAALTLSTGTLTPVFDPSVTAYASVVAFAVSDVTVTASSEDANATLTVNGAAVVSGFPSGQLPLGEGANVIEVRVTAENGVDSRTYTVNVDRQSATNLVQQALIKASNTDGGDEFGWAVALQGDTLAIGAPLEAGDGSDPDDDSIAGAGAVYVFTRSGDTWTQQAYLKAFNAGIGDEFGYSLALSDDTLAVGARAEASAVSGIDGNGFNNSATGAGAVYVYTRDAQGVWSQQAYIKASNTGAGDQFGTSVTLAGDTLAIGAPLEDSGADTVNGEQLNESATNAGAVYVFVRDALDTWRQQAYVKASNTDDEDRFGQRVALSADTLAVSAPQEDGAATGVGGDQNDDLAINAGAVYVFTRDGANDWSLQAYVKASNTDADDDFGSALALDGDTLAVGARYEDSTATAVDGEQTNDDAFNAGAAYVFTRAPNGAWSQQAYVKSVNGETQDRFGASAAIDGDTLVVGATGESSTRTGVNGAGDDNDAENAGAAYTFTRNAGIWSPAAYLKPSNTGSADGFATAVAISDDTIVAGAPSEDGSGTGIDPVPDDDAEQAGAGYVYAD